ncbi:hypothetical protein PCANB_001841 [Pneumocystis canis]|nr:hypothetical protein PCK1_002019 [Pneumocystis canis]KAG5440271.1 hypothetical protein PCANB_001841 [Pneumocystis canis]
MYKTIEPSSIISEKPISLELDLGNLSAFNINPLDTHSLKNNKEEYIISISKNNIQILINKIFSLTKVTTFDGSFIELPEPITLLPREKPIPKPKPETKWKKFAKAKGIKPKNKVDGKMIYDENKGKWVPKWGYKGKNKDIKNQWLIEINDNKNFDPKNLKKLRKKNIKQKYKKNRNIKTKSNYKKLKRNE